MNNQHTGFAVLGLLLVSVCIVVIAAAGWAVWLASDPSGGTTSQKTIEEPAPANTSSADVIRITLVDATTMQSLANQDFEFISQQDVQCVTTPCPTGEKRYAVRSDQRGRIVVPRLYVQEKNSVVGASYTSKNLSVNAKTDEYELTMLRAR